MIIGNEGSFISGKNTDDREQKTTMTNNDENDDDDESNNDENDNNDDARSHPVFSSSKTPFSPLAILSYILALISSFFLAFSKDFSSSARCSASFSFLSATPLFFRAKMNDVDDDDDFSRFSART